MKTTTILLLSATVAVTLAAGQNLLAADGSSRLAAIKQNAALAHSPRMIELYPELAWAGVASTAAAEPDTRARKLAEISKNLALANSPRMHEQFPELAVSRQIPATSSAKSVASTGQLARVMKNQALANSPRMKEQFPELRNNEFNANLESVGIAPLK